jgi:DNA recombination protein RmuC
MIIASIVIASALLIIAAAFLWYAISQIAGRVKDMHADVSGLKATLAVTDEMRRHASETIASLNERFGGLAEKAGRIDDVMTSVTSLKNLFVMPKAAGIAGERLLEKALGDILPADMYKTQYGVSSGTVDFVIKFRDCLVPVDSKLSLENFNRMLAATDDIQKRSFWKAFTLDVKKRIDETAKYILPGEKTTDFALMYIASESVYYEAFIKDRQFGDENTLADYAMKKHVYPTSPQTIYPYLVTILQGMKALKIEENAREILARVSGLRNDFERFKTSYNIIINHVDDALKKHAGDGQTGLTKIDQHISNLEQHKR